MKSAVYWLALFVGLMAEIWRAGADDGATGAMKWLRGRKGRPTA